VLEASDGKSALELLASSHTPVSITLTDVVMKGISGPEMVLRLLESHPEMKVVYMSGYTGELLGEHEALLRISLLEKPFTRASLLRTLHDVLG
jgi:DNA-binding NtrC family response regulator